MMKSGLDDNTLKKTDSSYMMYKTIKKREISPIVANTSKLQTSINVVVKSEGDKLKNMASHETKLSSKQLNFKKVFVESKINGIKGLPINYLSEALKKKALSGFPLSDRCINRNFK
jgi:hypothetical protein